MRLSSVIYFHIYLLVADGSINYCGSKMCGYTDDHTFCQYPPGPGPACLGYMEAHLSAEDKARVLGRLNRRRSEAARGLRRLPPAGDMLKLRWVEELAREAQRWADQCRPPAAFEEHDACRDLYSISVGQCVASVVGEAPGLRPESMVDMWYMQSIHYKGNVSIYSPPSTENYFDFAQMIWSRAYMVGCGRSKFMVQWRGRLRSVDRLVCNFAPRAPIAVRPLWTPALPSSACPSRSRPDSELVTLCTYQNDEYDDDEIFNSNNTQSLEEHLLISVIFEIERNDSVYDIGTLDEIYLTKLAVATLENPTTTQSYNSMRKRYIKNNYAVEEVNNNTFMIPPIVIPYEITKLQSNRKADTTKKKINLLGRPKSYNLEELNNNNEETQENFNDIQEITESGRSIYDDYEFKELSDNKATKIMNITEINHSLINIEVSTATSEKYGDNRTSLKLELINRTEMFEQLVDEMVSNITFGDANDTDIDDKVLDDYLSDPETMRELQKAIDRMEQKLASPEPASAKVRRELRNLDAERVQSQKNKLHVNNNVVSEELAREIERNKTRGRGPMLNMVLKYMPYLKQYENSIIGDPRSNSANVLSATSLLLLVTML